MRKIKTIELNNRDNSLNLLRLIFATFVLIVHSFFILSIDMSNFIPRPISTIMGLAVPCFFCISGYLITASAIKNNFKTFIKKRVARIYPAYFLCIILTVCIFAPITFALMNGGDFNMFNYIAQDPSPIKFFIYALPLKLFEYHIGTTLSIIHMHTWNASAWTLIFEFGCYISIALITILLQKLNIKKDYFQKIVLGIYLLLIISLIFTLPLEDNITGIAEFIRTYAHLLSIFLGGSFIYLIKDKIKFSLKLFILEILICIIIFAFLPNSLAKEISAIPITHIILFISVTLKSPKFIKENDISYGIYIYAWPIQCVLATFLTIYGIYINIWTYVLICWIITSIFATISWFLLEKPILVKVR